MNNSFGGKFEAVKSLFRNKKQILEERAAKEKAWALEPIKSIQDLEGFYTEFGDKEWNEDNRLDWNTEPSRKYEGVLSADVLEDDNYWEGLDDRDPKNKLSRDASDAELLQGAVAEDDMEGFENLDLSFTPGSDRFKEEDLDAVAPEVEEVNPHTPKESLKKKDLERQERMDARSKNGYKDLEGAKPVNLPLEDAEVKPERVKPEVIIDLEEKKEKEPSALDRFKLMKDVLTYKKLIKDNPDIDKLRPKRGDDQLSVDQIKDEMKAFREKQKGTEEISQAEKDFFKECETWTWAAQKVANYKGGEPKNPDGTVMSADQMDKLQKEYYSIKNNQPYEFAKLQLEVLGERNVAEGKWKKDEFNWKASNFTKNGDQWICDKVEDGMQVRYITSVDPNEIAPEGTPAEFFYMKGKEIPNSKNKNQKVVFVTIVLPKLETAKV